MLNRMMNIMSTNRNVHRQIVAHISRHIPADRVAYRQIHRFNKSKNGRYGAARGTLTDFMKKIQEIIRIEYEMLWKFIDSKWHTIEL